MTLTARAYAALIAHARAESPGECCGLLAGQGARIDEVIPVRNIHPTPASRYLLDPVEHIAANRRLRGTGRSVLGSYHSHPRSRAIPSETDVAEAYYADFVWVIVSLASPARPEVTAYRLLDQAFAPARLVVEP